MIRSGQKEKWIIYTLATLLCLVLASFWLMCNIYARYTSEASGSDEARVAKFDVTETESDGNNLTQQIKADVYPGCNLNYTVGVTNKSEVAIEYVMEIKNIYGNLPLQFKMLDISGLNGENRKEIPDKKVEISAQDHAEHTYQLNISWPITGNDASGISAQSPDYAGKTDVIEITLKAVQKD